MSGAAAAEGREATSRGAAAGYADLVATQRPHAVITYDGLPISAGGAHRLREKNHVATWESVLRFLHSFTTSEEPDHVRLLLAEGARIDGAFFAEAHRRARAAFGRAERRLKIAGEANEFEHSWIVNRANIGDALDLMEALEPFPEHWLGAPLELSVEAIFCLRDPDTGEVFAGQDPELYGGQEAAWKLQFGRSRLHLGLTTVSTCALFLFLPFPEVCPALRAYVRRVDESLPFRLSRKHWARWQLNEQGTGYYRRRVDVLGPE